MKLCKGGTNVGESSELIQNPINPIIIEPQSCNNQGIAYDLKLQFDSLNLYNHLPNHDKQLVENTIKIVNDILIFYKSMSYMYPDWTNCSENRIAADIDSSAHNLYSEIGYYMMTHIIDEKIFDIPGYRRSINNPFHRGIWHMASTINFAEFALMNHRQRFSDTHTQKESTFSDSLVGKFFRFLDAFCLLARPKTRKEFESTYTNIYRCITSESDNNKIIIPYWIHDQYANKNIANLMGMMIQIPMYQNTIIHHDTPGSYSQSVTLKEINKDMFFFLLSNTFVYKPIQIGSLYDEEPTKPVISQILEKYLNMGKNIKSNKVCDSEKKIFEFKFHTPGQSELSFPCPIPDQEVNYVRKQRYKKKYSNFSYVSSKTSNADSNLNWRALDSLDSFE
jgi:hypothetical protein